MADFTPHLLLPLPKPTHPSPPRRIPRIPTPPHPFPQFFVNSPIEQEREIRKIIHIDMDAFFASVEQRDNPELRGKPVVVGGSPNSRGVVAAASYEARKYGIHSAMPCATAYRLCPHAIFVRHRFDAYKEASRIIRGIFHEYTNLVEPLSLDEAFLDVTHPKKGPESATLIAKEIKQRIKEATQLTASAGISFNKFLAKMASDLHKPDGLSLIRPEHAADFTAQLPIHKFFGIGKKTAAKMEALGIHTGADLRARSREELIRRFGKVGKYYYKISRGQDDRVVNPHRETKSISIEDTFGEDLTDMDALKVKIDDLTEGLYRRLQKADKWGRTITLKVKYHDFTNATRSQSFPYPVTDLNEIATTGKELLLKTEAGEKAIRLLGIGTSNFPGIEKPGPGGQLQIEFPPPFDPYAKEGNNEPL